MRGTSHSSDRIRRKRKRDALRQKWEAWSVAHPLRSSLPFLSISSVILAASVLASSCTICYTVNAQGKPLVFFKEPETYDVALVQAKERTSAILNEDYSIENAFTVQTVLAPKNSIEQLTGVTDSIMEAIPELEHVYTLSVDGQLVGAAEDAETIRAALSLVKQHYTTPETRSLRFDSQVNLRYQYLPSVVGTMTTEELVAKLLAEQPRVLPYKTQTGDTVERITALFSTTPERLRELNPDVVPEPEPILGTSALESEDEEPTAADLRQEPQTIETTESAKTESGEGEAAEGEEVAEALPTTYTPLEAGLELLVEQSCPLLLVSTVQEQTLTRSVTPTIETQEDATMFEGQERILESGTAGEETALVRVSERCGVPVVTEDLSAITLTEAAPMIIGTGTRAMPELAEGCMFLWPVRGTMTSDYGSRFIFGKEGFHQGVDIAAPMGTAINAAAEGTVVFAGVKGTYGNLVILSHADGFLTYYGHCSKLLVTPGQTVSQGEVIAAVGSTGRSTGPHCHFEVRYQGGHIDPLRYLPGANNAPIRPLVPNVEVPETPVEQPKPPVVTEPAVPPTQPTTPTEPEPEPTEPLPTLPPSEEAPPTNTAEGGEEQPPYFGG